MRGFASTISGSEFLRLLDMCLLIAHLLSSRSATHPSVHTGGTYRPVEAGETVDISDGTSNQTQLPGG